GNERRNAIFRANSARDVSLAGHVLGQQDVTRVERDLLATDQLHLSPATQRDDILPTRRRMPVLKVVRRLPSTLQPGDLDQLRQLAGSARGRQLWFDVLRVGLTIGTREDPRDDDRLATLRNDRVVVGADVPYDQQNAHEQQEDNRFRQRPHGCLLSCSALVRLLFGSYSAKAFRKPAAASEMACRPWSKRPRLKNPWIMPS